MSFYRAISDLSPQSVKIKEDFLLSFSTLDRIESTLESLDPSAQDDESKYKLIDCRDDYINVTNVYNQNINYINERRKNFEPYAFPTYEAFRDLPNFGFHKDPMGEYQHQKTLSEFNYEKRSNELHQLSQTSCLCGTLSKKITRVFDRLKQFPSIADQLPPCILNQLNDLRGRNDKLLLWAPSLRKVTDPSIKVAAPSTLDVTVSLHLSPEVTLGICADPSWDKHPILLTKNEKGWSGEAPLNTDWKFVTLQNGKILKWEEGNNRRCDANSGPLNLNAASVKFK